MILATAPTTNKPSISSLKERHQEIKRRLIAGDRAVDICRDLGMTQSWFSIVTHSPVFQLELARLRAVADENAADVGARITRLAPDAMTVLERAIRNRQDETNISAFQQTVIARDLLDRANHGKPVASSQASASVRVEIVQFGAVSTEQKVVITQEPATENPSE